MIANTDQVYNISYDAQLNVVIMDWDGYATTAQFREGTETMLNILIENHAHKVLADSKDMILISMEDQRWLETQFLPRAIRFGMKACAIVRPNSYFNKIAIETVSNKISQEKLLISFFDTAEQAKAWLQGLSF